MPASAVWSLDCLMQDRKREQRPPAVSRLLDEPPQPLSEPLLMNLRQPGRPGDLALQSKNT